MEDGLVAGVEDCPEGVGEPKRIGRGRPRDPLRRLTWTSDGGTWGRVVCERPRTTKILFLLLKVLRRSEWTETRGLARDQSYALQRLTGSERWERGMSPKDLVRENGGEMVQLRVCGGLRWVHIRGSLWKDLVRTDASWTEEGRVPTVSVRGFLPKEVVHERPTKDHCGPLPSTERKCSSSNSSTLMRDRTPKGVSDGRSRKVGEVGTVRGRPATGPGTVTSVPTPRGRRSDASCPTTPRSAARAPRVTSCRTSVW